MTEPAYFQHEFQIIECATERGTPKSMVTYSPGASMNDVMQDALEALRALLESAQNVHPGMRLSLNPADWELQLVDVVSPLLAPDLVPFAIKNRLIWNLGLRKGSIWTEPVSEAVA